MNSEPIVVRSMEIEVSGITYNVNSSDITDFLQSCESFMNIDGNEFEIMTQAIADNIIDNSKPDSTIEQLRPQLKFLREVGFLLAGLVSQVVQ
jgi:hypothetical protein